MTISFNPCYHNAMNPSADRALDIAWMNFKTIMVQLKKRQHLILQGLIEELESKREEKIRERMRRI